MKKVLEVTPDKLASILLAFKTQKGAAIFASITQFTDARLRKTNNPYENVMKFSILSIMLNTEYETGVIKQLAREEKPAEDYKKGVNTMPLEFGPNNRFIGAFDGKFALQYRPHDNSKPRTKYVHKGKIIDKNKIESFLPKTYPAKNQGTEKEIFWRKVYLENIVKLTFNGITYKIKKETSLV